MTIEEYEDIQRGLSNGSDFSPEYLVSAVVDIGVVILTPLHSKACTTQ
jgi:hypothetical protein